MVVNGAKCGGNLPPLYHRLHFLEFGVMKHKNQKNVSPMIDLSKLPSNIKIEVSKDDLLAFADRLLNDRKPPTQPPESEILTLEEAAKFLSLAKQTLYGMTSKEEIPFYKRRRKLYFKRSDLLKWLEEGKHEMNAEDEVETYLRRRHQKNPKT